MSAQSMFEELVAHEKETALWQATQSLLEWDERTGMPIGGGDFRADQVGLLATTIHRRRTDPRVGQWLERLASTELAQDPHSDSGTVIRCLRREYERACRLPVDLVEALSRATVVGQQTWDHARKQNDYQHFKPALTNLVQLKREAAERLREPGQSLYDALMDDYEEGAQAEQITRLFADLRTHLVKLTQAIAGSKRAPDTSVLRRPNSVVAQRKLSRRVAEAIGFDFSRGRLDETSHPFCTSLGPSDCRILTRYFEDWLPAGFYGTLHEAGHGLYDQGLRSQWYGLPPGNFVSLGIHESQSRLWENLVGRSREFWQFFLPEAKSILGSTLTDVDVDTIYRSVNVSEPSLIRVEADEVTYNLHIIIRFDLEQALLEGRIGIDDLPDAWADRYESDLGVRPPNEKDGVLQDVHWSAGLFGYFPTYTLGNLIASQLWNAAAAELGNLPQLIAGGDFSPLLSWLRTHIHQPGRCYSANELVKRCTGTSMTSEPMISYLNQKFSDVYQL